MFEWTYIVSGNLIGGHDDITLVVYAKNQSEAIKKILSLKLEIGKKKQDIEPFLRLDCVLEIQEEELPES